MRKRSKVFTALVLVAMMLITMAVPAFAVDYGSKWASFSSISSGSTGVYVRFAQSYLYRFNSTTRSIMQQAGSSVMDGSFGSITNNATIAFQTYIRNYYNSSFVVDGLIGSQTWTYMANLTSNYGTVVYSDGYTHHTFTPNASYGIVGSRVPTGSLQRWYYNAATGTSTSYILPYTVVTN